MANPATELADLLDSWAVPAGVTPETARGDETANSTEFWATHRRALHNMLAVERMADALAQQGKTVDYIREIFPDLYKSIFAVTTPWTSSDGSNLRRSLHPWLSRTLRTFGGHFEEYDVDVDVDGIEAIRASLEDVERLLLDASQQDMPRNTRIYLLGLIRDALEALDNPMEDGGRRIRTATHAVAGALTAELTQIPDVPVPAGAPAGTKNFRQRFVTAANRVIVTTVMAFAVAFGTQAGEAGWQLTETAVAQVFDDLSDEAKSGTTAPALGPAPERLQLPPGSGDDPAN